MDSSSQKLHGSIPPVEAEANYHAGLEATPMATENSNKPASGKPRAVHRPKAENKLGNGQLHHVVEHDRTALGA
jgi:hypothetical protein